MIEVPVRNNEIIDVEEVNMQLLGILDVSIGISYVIENSFPVSLDEI